ncbi:PLP-dependent aminotransferase family protein [Mitsuaria sp. GD03876]|uniref:MocR-like pyridoxine biosynthesis transcription factor PdxR n=1 Tax=Mitsuaria sp. GD03876 TaxID=2975399 RepID=UPI0024471D57|nr:PLP-dependent aminotransferase family protein [Mitsuaria sp. GD03876]MDH0867356.1 PLP-dependent aminotransferase family protein [Mitsuaria sp. GD03876]
MTRATDTRKDIAAQTLHDQICARFRALIADGRMAPGSRAPSLRALAVELGVARGTVEAAYDRLIGEGYLHARGTAGTFVADRLPQPSASTVPAPAAGIAAEKASPDVTAVSASARRARPATSPSTSGTTSPEQPAVQLDGAGPAPLPFQLGVPALDAFPRKVWARLVAHHARRMDSLMKPDPFGLPRLREALVVYLHRSRGVEATARQVFVVPGYEPGLALAVDALLARGDTAIVEDPGYPPTAHLLRRQGISPVPVLIDGEGLDIATLAPTASAARLAVVTPSHQSPTGVSLGLQRRLALLDWAAARDAWIFEDDYDGEYRYHGHPLPALKSLDRQGRVLYAGTLSKVLYPGLRLAYVVVPPALVETFERAARRAPAGGCPSLMQEVVADFIEQGHFARHIKRMRALYGHRRDWLLEALKPHARLGLSCQQHRGGMHVTIALPAGADDTALARQARDAGLAVHALSDWSQLGRHAPALLASFTNLESPEAATDAVRRLVAALKLKPLKPVRPVRPSR